MQNIRAVVSVAVLLIAVAVLPAQAQLSVTLDVREAINPHSKGVIAVAILCAPDPLDPAVPLFDPNTLDQSTLLFGPDAEAPAFPCASEDVNADGCPDLVCHFRTQGSGIACGDTTVALTGATTDGTLVSGDATMHTVGCGDHGKGKGPKPK